MKLGKNKDTVKDDSYAGPVDYFGLHQHSNSRRLELLKNLETNSISLASFYFEKKKYV